MKTHLLITLAGLALVTTACSTTAKVSTIPGMDITTKLGRSDYVVLGTSTGQACAEESCFLGSCTKKASVAGEETLEGRAQSESLRQIELFQPVNPFAFLLGTPQTTQSGSDIAEKIAMYKAIESIAEADAILSPRIEKEVTENSIPLFSRTVKSCVTVKGKAVRIKPDSELNK